VATPLSPNDVDHLTAATPAVSDAVPLSRIVAAVVETMEPEGDVMEIDGGVVSGFAGGCTGGAGGGGVGFVGLVGGGAGVLDESP